RPIGSGKKRNARAILAGLVMPLSTALVGATAAEVETRIVTMQQGHTGRYADAWETDTYDLRLMTRPRQTNDTKRRQITNVGGNIYTIQQESNGRYVDAYESAGNDWNMVTRPAQNNATQQWLFTPLGGDIYTIQQISTGRYVDAWE